MNPKPFFFLPIFFFLATCCRANDGAFRANGNHLIPMYETDISVQKEILTIRRINPKQAQITVYYEFFNPKQEKELEVGFEAFSPSGDADHSPSASGQRYISHFTVNLNGAMVPWHVAIVNDTSYYRAGRYKTITLAQAEKEGDEEEADFFYVYHFRATFHKGVNILQHTYTVDFSSSVVETYSLQYVLTAAKRWANHQIDDFTLQLDMGDYQDLSISQTFFQHSSEWTMTGPGNQIERKEQYGDEKTPKVSQFFMRKGILVFKKMNFRPAGELYLTAVNSYFYYTSSLEKHTGNGPFNFDYRLDDLPFSVDAGWPGDAADALSKKILHNLPFARRGYIFKTPEIQAYYARQPWYIPDSSYRPVISELTRNEQVLLSKE
ncbi:YARHG domain-containing protein [Dinghuibacter silviterrae]|uniref:YARHG domain-containing protein n=1 Tax=Dinghuibacter silviterrae TaxID=1539049 RepID=A0A4R8DII5_9BACT|nr:YARHG domain-containing protein [Dinghuibacter silviterrae]TDW97559.1 YARHG domain-containing protein [Dinghuibacter silviterrae]